MEKYLVTAEKDGKLVYATAINMESTWTASPELAYTYDERDNPAVKLAYWRMLATRKGMNPATVCIEPLGDAAIIKILGVG